MMVSVSVFSIHRSLVHCVPAGQGLTCCLTLTPQLRSNMMKLFAVPLLAAGLGAITFMMLPAAEAGKSSVDIINFLIGEPMSVHCQSRDDDLHWQLLQTNQDYHFDFHENILHTTVFWCRFVWGPNGKNWQSFTVWDQKHPWDMPLECGNCLWRAQSDGVYIWDKYNYQYDFWKAWNTDGPVTFANDTNPPVSWEMPAVNASLSRDN